MTGRVVYCDRFQDLKKSRIGKSEREQRVEDRYGPSCEIVEIIVSYRSEGSRPIDTGESIVFLCPYLPCEMREGVESCGTRTFLMKNIDFSVFT